MQTRAATLAEQFEQINTDLIATVESCSDADWQRTCAGETWPVGVTAHHVALSYPAFQGFILDIANGAAPPAITREMLDDANHHHAAEAANCTRAETLELLRHNGVAVVEAVRGLTDAQLDRSAPMALTGGASVSAQQLTEILIGHPIDHLASIRTTLGR